MTPKELMKAVDLTEEKYIAEAAVPPVKHGIFGFNGAKAALAAAACLAVFLLAGIVLKNNVLPTQTTPTEDIPPISETEDMTTAKDEPSSKKSTQPTESSAEDRTQPTTQRPTEPPFEEPSGFITEPPTEKPTEPIHVYPSDESSDFAVTDYAPTAPTQAPPDESEPQSEPSVETTTQSPAYKTITEVLEEMGLLDGCTAGEGELLGKTDPLPEGTSQPVITELTAEELAAYPGFVLPESISLPEGFALAEFYAASYLQDNETAISAQYCFSSESDAVTVMSVRRDGMTLPETAKGLAAENVNGTEVYYIDNSLYKLPDEQNEYLAVFMTKDILYVVLGCGTELDTERIFELCKIIIK